MAYGLLVSYVMAMGYSQLVLVSVFTYSHVGKIQRQTYGRENERMMYAIWVNIDYQEWDYVRKSQKKKLQGFSTDDPILTFLHKEDADKEASKWNTGRVVEYMVR